MLPGLAAAVGASSINARSTLREVLNALGFGTNLKLILDAGDAASVASGSQAKWLDVSGNGYDFFLGTDATSQSSDPTFNGTPGNQSASEYYSFDGGDSLAYDTTPETWMSAMHKNSATFTLLFWFYFSDSSATDVNLWNSGAAAGVQPGVRLTFSASTLAPLLLVWGSGLAWAGISGAPTLTRSAWNFLAVSVNEAAGSFVMHVNGSAVSESNSYSSPSSSNSSFVQIGGALADGNALPSGSRISAVAAWEGTALSEANLATIFTATRGKYGV